MTTSQRSSPATHTASRFHRRTQRSEAARAWQHLYKTARWQALRHAHLTEHPLCEWCLKKNPPRLVPANVVHHKERHEGDPEKFFGGELEALCKRCHDSEAQSEERNAHKPMFGADGWMVEQPAKREDTYSIPWGLKPSAVPVHLVCGPPAAGKSTYVRERAKPDDIVIDLDDILVELGCQRWDNDRANISRAFKVRDERLRNLSRCTQGEAWVVMVAATDKERAAWRKALGRVRVHAIETELKTCMQRIMSDPERAHARQRLRSALERYATDRGIH